MNTPPILSALEQRDPGSGDVCQGTDIAVPVGNTFLRKTICLEANIADPADDKIRLEIEVKPVDTDFDGTLSECWPDCSTFQVIGGTGNTKTLTVSGLSYGTRYHWRARVLDEFGGDSGWSPFPTAPNPSNNDLPLPADTDFEVVNDPPTVSNVDQVVDDDGTCDGTGGETAVSVPNSSSTRARQ